MPDKHELPDSCETNDDDVTLVDDSGMHEDADLVAQSTPSDNDADESEEVDGVSESIDESEEEVPSETSSKKAKHAKKKSKRFKIIAGVCGFFCVLCIVVLGVAAYLCNQWLQDLPDYSDADAFNVIKPTEVYANDRTTLLARFQLENRVPLSSLDEISEYAVVGTVATEDERFYQHNGFDIIGIGRALINNMTGGTLEGASTITQQLVRNTVLLDEMSDVSYKRKVREIFLAIQLEKLYTKDEILLLYLNTINYGGGAYGIEAAAQRYYSKSAAELTLAEAAALIGIPQSPTSNCPFYYPDNTYARRSIVLDRMVSYGLISQEEADAARNEEIVLNPSDPSLDGFLLYPYFASYVRDQLMSSYNLSKSELFQGGLTVYTTLDLDTQALAEKVVDQQEANINSELSIAMTAVDPSTGFVKAMVGGKDFYANQWNLAAQAQRQPGSAFKTFTLLTAIEQGISPQTAVSCTSWLKLDGYRVENIGGANYGIRSIAGAFAVSSNTGFIRVCAAVGPENVAEMAHRLGVKSNLDPYYSITLGSEEVTTLEMAGAFGTIANAGVRHDTVVIEQVLDRKGNVIIDHTASEGEQVISPEVARAAIGVMEGVVTGGTGTAARLSCGQPVAGKTGTSEEARDSYFCGITPQLSVAVWIGDPNNQVGVYGIDGATVYGAFMNRWMEGREVVPFFEAGKPKYTKYFSNTDLDVSGISSIKDPNSAPNLKGMTLSEILGLLRDYNYSTKEEYSDDVPKGSVISQHVSGNKLVVVVSKGKKPEEEKKDDKPAASDKGNGGSNAGGGSGNDSGGTGGTGGGSDGGGQGGAGDAGNQGGAGSGGGASGETPGSGTGGEAGDSGEGAGSGGGGQEASAVSDGGESPESGV